MNKNVLIGIILAAVVVAIAAAALLIYKPPQAAPPPPHPPRERRYTYTQQSLKAARRCRCPPFMFRLKTAQYTGN